MLFWPTVEGAFVMGGTLPPTQKFNLYEYHWARCVMINVRRWWWLAGKIVFCQRISNCAFLSCNISSSFFVRAWAQKQFGWKIYLGKDDDSPSFVSFFSRFFSPFSGDWDEQIWFSHIYVCTYVVEPPWYIRKQNASTYLEILKI